MAHMVIVHVNTETKEVDLGDNDKVAWVVLHNNKHEMIKYFKELTEEEQKRLWKEKHDRDMALRNRSYANAEKTIKQCPIQALEWILNELWDYNARMWLDNEEMHDKGGYENVLNTGFTGNQLRWIEKLYEKYKNPLPTIMHLDELVKVCGYFTSNVETNNGYG